MERTLRLRKENAGSKLPQQGKAQPGPSTNPLPQLTSPPPPPPACPASFCLAEEGLGCSSPSPFYSLCPLGGEPVGAGFLSFPSLALCYDFSMETGSGRGGNQDIWSSEQYQISIIKCLVTQ